MKIFILYHSPYEQSRTLMGIFSSKEAVERKLQRMKQRIIEEAKGSWRKDIRENAEEDANFRLENEFSYEEYEVQE